MTTADASQERSERRRSIGWALLVAGIVIAAFSPAFSAGFLLWDDDKNFLENARWRGLSFGHLRWMATTLHGGPYQPLSWLSLAIDHALWGMDPRGYHATNVLLHAAAAVVFFFLARRLLPLCLPGRTSATASMSASPLAAAAAALFFAVHPLRVESVAWVTERRDVLSGIFVGLAVLAWLRYAAAGDARIQPRMPSDRARRGAYAASLAWFVLALLSKASGVVLPLALLVLDAWPLRRPWRRALAEKIPYVLIALPFAALAVWGQASGAGELRTLGQHGVTQRLAQAACAAVFYPLRTLLPFGLSPIYELPRPFDPFEARFVVVTLVVLGASAALFGLRRRLPAAAAAWAAFLVILAPVSGLVQAGPQIVADRYSYLACMPFALLAAGVLFAGRPKAATSVSCAIVVVLSVLTWKQTRIWRDTQTLFEHALEVDPSSPIAHSVLGKALQATGRSAEAAEQYRAAIALSPGHAVARNNLGLILMQEEKLDEAIEQFRAILSTRPDYIRGRSNLGVALFRRGDVAEAEAELLRAVADAPRDAGANLNLGHVLAARGSVDEAIGAYERVLELDPRSAEAHLGLARAYAKRGRADLAESHARAAQSLRGKP